jgi:hypothetical protein
MAQSILEDLVLNEANKLPGWSFVHFGASEVIPSVQLMSSEKKK